MESVFLVSLRRAKGKTCYINASVVAGVELDVRGVAYHVCQPQFEFAENSRDMVAWLR